jgi:protein-S-isoprenylcysteine O-methyltransferase Ste14
LAAAALVLYGVSLALTFGVRIAVQAVRTGSTGVNFIGGGAGSLEWLAGGLFALAVTLGAAAPVLALTGVLEPIPALDGAVGHAIGIGLAVAGIALTFAAQLAMGDSWRIGVDEEERTDLVTDGPFAIVRNPIYGAMIPGVLGLALMVPSVVAIAAFTTAVVGLELQVRFVEEPHLLRTHGISYAEYASRVGRFVPGVGYLDGIGSSHATGRPG